MVTVDCVILVALNQEIPECFGEKQIPVVSLKALRAGDTRGLATIKGSVVCVVTGVGFQHAVDACRCLQSFFKSLMWINIGSCGSSRLDYGGKLLCPYRWNDENGNTALCWGQVPFLSSFDVVYLENGVSVTAFNPAIQAECIDMEAYVYADFCEKNAIAFTSIKYVTDFNNSFSKHDFQARLSQLRSAFCLLFDQVLEDMGKDVAVVIPTYNRRSTLKACIDSVLAQTHSTECIVIDDGSTDGTRGLLDSYGHLIRVVAHKQRYGVSVARHNGVAYSTGDLICFLDSDDVWDVTKIENQVAFMKKHSFFSLIQSEDTWIRNGKQVNKKMYHRKPDGFVWDKCLERCLITPSSVMIKRRVYDYIGGFDSRLAACEDYDLWLRLSRCFLVGLEPSCSLTKFGGHSDQLSVAFSLLDRFRLFALKQQVYCEKHPFFKQKLEQVISAKEKIVYAGALKRSLI